MKRNLLCSVYLLCILMSLPATAQTKSITVYSDDFAGSQAMLGPGKYDYMQLVRLGAGLVRSVRVPEGMMVTLYTNDNFQGNSITLTDDANKRLLSMKGFGEIMPNISLVVSTLPDDLAKAPYVTIYKDNFAGPSRKLRAGVYDFFELGAVDNDQLSSVKIPKGMKVTLYEHAEMGGRSLEFTSDVSATVLKEKKFNDLTSSISVEVLPQPEPSEKPVEKPKEEPTPVEEPKPTEPTQPEKPETTIKGPVVTIYFSNSSRRFAPGRYDAGAIGDDRTLSSLRMPTPGLRVILYAQPGFTGKSLTIEDDMITKSYFESNNFLKVGSLVVEALPSVTLYQGNYSGDEFTFYQAGEYRLGELGIANDELSSVRVGAGFWVLLFEDDNFGGESVLLTKDASADFLAGKDFDDRVSSLVIGTTAMPVPIVTVYQEDFEGPSMKLTPGEYGLLAFNNSISSVEVPRTMRVTLYDEPSFQGKSMVLRASIGQNYLQGAHFDNAASSARIELLQPKDYTVTIYTDQFKGFGQDLLPGKYRKRDIQLGDNTVSSIHVPPGMKVTLYEHDNFEGMMQWVDRDTDFTGSRYQDNVFSSFIVEDAPIPVFRETTVITTESPQTETKETPPPTETPSQPTVVNWEPPCEMSEKEFYTALKSIEAKAFSEEKMTMARLTTKDKCLTVDQVRQIARQFQFEDQTLEFIKYAYDLSKEKAQYYTLEDVFKFMSSRDAFLKFLKAK